jgi:outer membrane protein assembly factor BamE (lipoprotein component of BamABCDE complex)
LNPELVELAKTNVREAMKKEIEINQQLVDNSSVLHRNTARIKKEAVFYAMARNDAIRYFLNLDESKQDEWKKSIPTHGRMIHSVNSSEMSADYKNLMYRISSTSYAPSIKRSAEVNLYFDYTHADYKRRRYFLDEELPERPKSSVLWKKFWDILDTVGEYISGFFAACVWLGIISFLVIAFFFDDSSSNTSSSTSSSHRTSSGNGNTFGAGGVSGGNSSSKSVSNSPQVKDGSGQAGFGNGGKSGHDAPSSAETKASGSISGNKIATVTIDNVSSGKTTEESTGRSMIPKLTPISTESDEDKFDVKEGCFSIGSTKDEVISVMGEPDTKASSSFSYGFSLVFFNNDKVSGWSKIDRDLKVSIGDKKEGAAPFTVGSTKRQVVDAMGTPSSTNTNSFTYSYSLVFFDTGGKVSGWSEIDRELKVTIGDKKEGAAPFTVGSTIDEVVAVMGTPDSYNATSLSYGYSLIFFQNGKVSTIYTDIRPTP